jgi:hypothetical protein
MTAIERKLASKLLTLAADEFSNHGCNDFHLLEDGDLTEAEAKEVQEALMRDGMSDEVASGFYSWDWLLMRWLAKKLAP